MRRGARNLAHISSPPPLIEVQDEGEGSCDVGVQTPPISPETVAAIQEAVRKEKEKDSLSKEESEVIKERSGGSRRRSSVDHDDVSPSVSDTIKRYLRMARKKSLDADKADQFKRVNYDRNLRNIKAKGEITKPGDDDGLNKGAQTDEMWVDAMREIKVSDVAEAVSRAPSSRSSVDEGSPGGVLSPSQGAHHHKGLLSSGHNFLSNLLHGLQHAAGVEASTTGSGVSSAADAASASVVGAMQKSKSSSSVMQHSGRMVAKKLWKARSKSQGRVAPTCSWTPQGRCTWSSLSGRSVTLGDCSLLSLSELERRVLCKVALAKLQALNLGVNIRVPSESVNGSSGHKPKRRPQLLKRKARTTGIFDTARKDADKDKGSDGGLVFGIPLTQCLENERVGRGGEGVPSPALRRQSGCGSRASFSSLIEIARPDESGSCESLAAAGVAVGGGGAGPRPAGSVPGLLDSLSSCGSASELLAPGSDPEPAVPRIVCACFRHLERYGLDTLGLFRVSTSKKRVRQLREEFDCGKNIVLGEDHCPHDVATLLKEFFRDLPEPLLSRDLYDAFVHTQRIRNRRLQFEALQHLVQLLPAANRDTLHALMVFLATVAAHAGDRQDADGEWVSGNKMDTNNLATVFAPNVLHCVKPGSTKEISAERAEDRIDVINVVRALIDHHQVLFTVPAELLDEVYMHMMDSHPEALDQLLRQRDAQADEFPDEAESGSEATSPVEAEAPGEAPGEPPPPPHAVRRVWSREEFLHERAATGGPDVAMRPNRYRERGRERPAKKRWSEDASAATSVGASGAPSPAGAPTAPARRRPTDASEHAAAESPHAEPGVITASLKIPVSGPLNLDVPDIPFIEDGMAEVMRQQMTFGPGGLIRSGSNSATRRRRQRTTSGGSDSSQTSPMGGPPADSALGSSATYSSPPRNTPSLGSSSEAGLYSSPPSWASSPPTSPDAATSGTSIDFPSEDVASAKLSITTKSSSKTSAGSVVTAKEMTPVILQKVTFTSTSELKQVQRTEPAVVPDQPSETALRNAASSNLRRVQKTDISKSASAFSVLPSSSHASHKPPTATFAVEEPSERQVERKLTTSISSIGGAVLRSKTADIERMLSIQKAETGKTMKMEPIPPEPASGKQVETQEKKKYTKRRYTDSRHQTRHIPDPETLQDATAAEISSVASTVKTDISRKSRQGPVWKRRELIASDPKQHENL